MEYKPLQALARAPVLVGAGYLALRASDHRAAQDYFDQALATSRDTQDHRLQAFALCGLGSIAQAQRDVLRATNLYREGWKKFEGAGNPWETANALLNLAVASLRQNDVHEARKLFSASLDGFRHSGDKKSVVQVLTHLGLLAYDQQQYVDASHFFHEALDMVRGLSNKLSTATLLRHLGYAALHQEHHTQAHQYLCEALTLFKEINQRSSIADVLYGVAGAVAHRHKERAAQLIGAAEMLLQTRFESNVREEQDRQWVIKYVSCDTESLQAARHAGTLLSLEQTIDLATQPM